MDPDQIQPPEGSQSLIEEDEEPSNPFTLATAVVGVAMALSLLGSLLWRAFPPSIFMRGHNLPVGPLATPGVELSVPVEASAGWVGTGFELATGASYLITASGQIQLGLDWLPDQTIGPQGFSSNCLHEVDKHCSLDGAPYGALVGRIDGGQPFLVGVGLQFTPEDEGQLWLSANDREGEFEDNEGTFIVTIERSALNGFERASILPPSLSWR